MLLSYCAPVLFGLVASVSAIDAYYHVGENCDGPSVVCSNLNPGVCCTDGRTRADSIGYRGIPTNWVIAAKSYGGSACDSSPAAREVSQNTNFLCLRTRFGNTVGATRYDFGANSKRRDDFSVSDNACLPGGGDAETEACTSSQKPDQLVLEDGTKFDIAGLEDNVVDQMIKLAREGTAIPVTFHSRKL
ncbi:hypothetical protein V8F20_005107 [Naviculisporaceae sp. PSN 640]